MITKKPYNALAADKKNNYLLRVLSLECTSRFCMASLTQTRFDVSIVLSNRDTVLKD